MILSILNSALLAFAFLSWGSFLNVVAYRLLHGTPFFLPRSRCPACSTVIAWYDLMPVLSWVILRGRCRTCKKSISLLYPLVELVSLAVFWQLFSTVTPAYWLGYGLFFSALIVTIRTDLEVMIIIRWFTLGMLPLAWVLSYVDLLPISLPASLAGAALGYGTLTTIRLCYLALTGLHGMGDGDPELLCCIGAFVGSFGCLIALLIGSFLGSLVGLLFFITYGISARTIKIPFGPFLALGAIFFALYHNSLTPFFTHLF